MLIVFSTLFGLLKFFHELIYFIRNVCGILGFYFIIELDFRLRSGRTNRKPTLVEEEFKHVRLRHSVYSQRIILNLLYLAADYIFRLILAHTLHYRLNLFCPIGAF